MDLFGANTVTIPKVLTLWQPWATLLAYGEKNLETRPGTTTYRGTYLIHAAKSFPGWAKELCIKEPFKSALQKCGVETWKDLPTGAIVGEFSLLECVKIINPNYACSANRRVEIVLSSLSEQEYAFGDYASGRWIWIGSHHRVLKEPLPYTNGQGYYLNFNGDYSQLEFQYAAYLKPQQ